MAHGRDDNMHTHAHAAMPYIGVLVYVHVCITYCFSCRAVVCHAMNTGTSVRVRHAAMMAVRVRVLCSAAEAVMVY